MPSDVVDLAVRLVATPSVNPSLVPGGAGETAVAQVVADFARSNGLAVERHEATAGRPSVVVRARGTGDGGRTLLLCGHLDTVGVAGMAAPHEPRLDGDRLHGRGAYDMKTGLAAALVAARDAARLRLSGDVVVAAVADEEHSSLGVREVLERLDADAAIVTEPTDLRVVVAHKGFAWSEVTVQGRAAHGSRPDLGVDPIVAAGPVLTALGRLDRELAGRRHARLGAASVHASTIAGGAELSSYAEHCTVGVERRTLPGETDVETELAALLDDCREREPDLRIGARTLLVRDPFEQAEDVDVVRALRRSVEAVTRRPSVVGGFAAWTDASFIAAAGIPTALFGPSGAGAHATEEWVSVASAETVVQTLVAVARRLCT